MRNGIVVFVILCVSLSCVEQVDFQTPEGENILVVEGFITDAPGPHTIRISRSAQYGSIFDGNIQRLANAVVALRNSAGINFSLTQTGPGEYSTDPSFQGIPGETYTLLITTNIGQRYTSLPVTLPNGPDLEDVDFRFRSSPSGNELKSITGVEVYARWTDPEGEDNFHMWRTEGIYQVETNPELFIDPNTGNPAPKACCNLCFVYEPDNTGAVFIHSDENQDGRELAGLAAFIVDDGKRFNRDYTLRIQQFSVSREAFGFLDLLGGQLEIDGDIFDAPPAQVTGNMVSLDDPSEAVIGFFGAYHISEMVVTIPSSIIAEPKPRVRVNDDCQVLPNATVAFPNPWN